MFKFFFNHLYAEVMEQENEQYENRLLLENEEYLRKQINIPYDPS